MPKVLYREKVATKRENWKWQNWDYDEMESV